MSAGTARFLYHKKLRKIDFAVVPCPTCRKATIGEGRDAGTARFLYRVEGGGCLGRLMMDLSRFRYIYGVFLAKTIRRTFLIEIRAERCFLLCNGRFLCVPFLTVRTISSV